MNQKQLITIAALASFALTAQAATVTVGPNNANRVTDYTGTQAGTHNDGTLSTWDGQGGRYWHSLLNTDSTTFNAALASQVGALLPGQSYQINSATLVVGSTTANSKGDTYNSPTAEAYVVSTAYNPANVTFNDSDTAAAADWVGGQFTAGGADFTSSNFGGSNLILGGAFTETGAAGGDITGYTTFTFSNTVVQSWLTTSQNIVLNGGDVGGWSSETGIANVNWVLDATIIPEPGTYALLGGLLALGYVMVRRRR